MHVYVLNIRTETHSKMSQHTRAYGEAYVILIKTGQ